MGATGENFGFAFVNWCHENPTVAERALHLFQGFRAWRGLATAVLDESCIEPCEAAWAEPLQGLDRHIQRYRDSPVMHSSVPDEQKPVVFSDGVRVAFPPPTRLIKPPRRL